MSVCVEERHHGRYVRDVGVGIVVSDVLGRCQILGPYARAVRIITGIAVVKGAVVARDQIVVFVDRFRSKYAHGNHLPRGGVDCSEA